MSFLSVCWLLIVSLLVLGCDAEFEWPPVTIEPLRPRGFRVSIPHQPGISLFAFHGKINEEMEGREAGTFSVDITKAKNNRWTYNNKIVTLKPGDIIYYWTYVDYNDGITGKLGYPLDDQQFVVTELYDNNVSGPIPTPSQPSQPSQATPTSPSCKPSETTVQGRSVCKGYLILEENFNDGLRSPWTASTQFTTYPDYSYVMYENDHRNLYVSNGILHIKPTPSDERHGSNFNKSSYDFGQQCTGVKNTKECKKISVTYNILPPVVSAQITTKSSFSFLYGIVEIRARFPQGDWIYPELFLQPRFENYGQFADSGFLRIAISAGNDYLNGELHGGGVISDSTARKYLQKRIVRRKPWNDDYNTYRLEWRPNYIQMSVNGEVYGNIAPPKDGFASVVNQLGLDINKAERWRRGSNMAPFDKEFFLGIGVGVGGLVFTDFESSPSFDFETPKSELRFSRMKESWYSTWNDRSVLDVDYVKVWAL